MDPFLGEIRLFGLDYDPQSWLPCDGRQLRRQQYPYLYQLLGNTYGGDAVNFNLPDLRERILMGAGQGEGLTARPLGAAVGESRVALTPEQLPPHSHSLEATLLVSQQAATSPNPEGAYFAVTAGNQYGEDTDNRTLATGLVSGVALPIPGGQEHLNVMPSLVLRYVICVDGLWPGQE